jgi:hypothetical protein
MSAVDSLVMNYENMGVDFLNNRSQDMLAFQKRISQNLLWLLGYTVGLLMIYFSASIYYQKRRFRKEKEYFQKEIDDTIIHTSKELEHRVNSLVEKTIESKVSGIKTTIAGFRKDLVEQSVEIKTLHIDILKSQSSPRNTILNNYLSLVKTAVSAKDAKYDWCISDCLIEMDKLIGNEAYFDSTQLKEINELLNSLNNQFSDTVRRIKEKISKME